MASRDGTWRHFSKFSSKCEEKNADISKNEASLVKYHSVSCYSIFVKASKRSTRKTCPVSTDSDSTGTASTSGTFQISTDTTRIKRRRTSEIKTCIICGSNRRWNAGNQDYDYKMYRICEVNRAQKLLNAAELLQDSVVTRLSTCYDSDVGAVFAADFEYHKSCMRKYLIDYDRKIESIMDNLEKENTSTDQVREVFNKIVSTLDLENISYSVSYVREEMNKLLCNDNITNRSVKTLLLENYGQLICFTYPHNRRNSQMFFHPN